VIAARVYAATEAAVLLLLPVLFSLLRAVDGASLSADKGETIGLLGPNGAEKTTVSVIAGLLRPVLRFRLASHRCCARARAPEAERLRAPGSAGVTEDAPVVAVPRPEGVPEARHLVEAPDPDGADRTHSHAPPASRQTRLERRERVSRQRCVGEHGVQPDHVAVPLIDEKGVPADAAEPGQLGSVFER
jgi:hypothetical protein